MRFPLLFWPVMLAFVGLLSGAAHAASALVAVKLLPKGKAAKLARIEARDGTPEPDRWYLLVHDVAEENGLHEYVVSGGEIVASRGISQFADALKAEDVIGTSAVKLDSDRAAKIAREYAQANGATISKVNYQLKREGADASPAWKITCLGENGAPVGEVTVTAGKGNVISHEGFPISPVPVPTATPAEKKTEPKKKPAPKFDVYTESQVAPGTPAPTAAPAPTLPVYLDPGEENYERRGRRRPHGEDNGGGVGGAARGVGRTLRRFLPF